MSNKGTCIMIPAGLFFEPEQICLLSLGRPPCDKSSVSAEMTMFHATRNKSFNPTAPSCQQLCFRWGLIPHFSQPCWWSYYCLSSIWLQHLVEGFLERFLTTYALLCLLPASLTFRPTWMQYVSPKCL